MRQRFHVFRRLRQGTQPSARHQARFEDLEARSLLSATVLEVNTTADVVDPGDAYLSLREAVLAANASPGDEEIHLPAGHYLLTRVGSNENFAQTGDLDIRNSGSLTILGAGRDATTIDAAGLAAEPLDHGDRIFEVHGARFAIEGLTLTGSKQSGALTNTGGVVSIAASSFVGNRASAGAAAIVNAGPNYTARGWMSIDDTLFVDNVGSAGYVGAIATYAETIVANSTFERNRGGLLGGAMLVGGQYAPRVEIRNSTFVENQAAYGGAIQALSFGGTLTIANSVFERNQADAGGAVAFVQSTGTISSSRFVDNHAAAGGAILVALDDRVLVADSLIAGNTADGSGGGIFGPATVWNSTIANNQANGDGGGISDKTRVLASTIVGNRADADGDGSGAGGGLFSIANVRNSLVIGNLRGAPGAETTSDIEMEQGSLGALSMYNLIGDPATAGGLDDSVGNNIVGDGLGGSLDPLTVLQPDLADLGGLNLAIALAPGSAAIDAGGSLADLQNAFAAQLGNNFGNTALPSGQFDQRGPGYRRLVGPSVDIGAIESGASFAGAVDGRRVFYENSLFDGRNSDVLLNLSAVDYNKRALREDGVLASASNITNYSRGVNGVMFDLAGTHPSLSAADFAFRVGVTNSPGSWATAPAPAAIQVLAGLGAGGSDRVMITWPDGAIKNTYLQVTVLANLHTGLAAPDVFYFGNRVGDAFTSQAPGAFVTILADELAVRNASPNNLLPLDSPVDFDKDGKASLSDILIARNNAGLLPRLSFGSVASAVVDEETLNAVAAALSVPQAVPHEMRIVGAELASVVPPLPADVIDQLLSGEVGPKVLAARKSVLDSTDPLDALLDELLAAPLG